MNQQPLLNITDPSDRRLLVQHLLAGGAIGLWPYDYQYPEHVLEGPTSRFSYTLFYRSSRHREACSGYYLLADMLRLRHPATAALASNWAWQAI